MNHERATRWLEAEHDGELRGWRRWALRRALARSPGLRAERAALRAIGRAVREAEPAPGPVDVWSGIAPRLAAIDRERRARETGGSGRERRGVAPWWPALAAAAGVATAVGLFWMLDRGAPVAPTPQASLAGTRVRSLDTDGRAVWVQEREGATIIWLVDAGADEA